MFIRPIKDDAVILSASLKPHNVHNGQRGILDSYHIGIFQHFLKNVKANGYTRSSWNVIEDKGQLRRIDHGIPIFHYAIFRLRKVEGRNRRDRIYSTLSGIGCQFHSFISGTGTNVSNNRHFSAYFFCYRANHLLALFNSLIYEFTGATSQIDTLGPFSQAIPSQHFASLRTDVAFLIIAGWEGWEYTLEFFQIDHKNSLAFVNLLHFLKTVFHFCS